MWLVNIRKDNSLESFLESELPKYAILSHTWQNDEVSFQDMQSLFRKRKSGWEKIKSACDQAAKDGLQYLWADTCCIDKTSSAELQEAINSMFRWYEKASVCYVYLSDVQCPSMSDDWAELDVPGEQRAIRVQGHKLQRWKQAFSESRWFTRGWTLQELIAPRDVNFYNSDWNLIGTKSNLIKTISKITRIEPAVLTHTVKLSSISIAKRMSWAAQRRTSRVEDIAYSLLGIFDVNIPMLYGEGNKAFTRLQEEIIKTSTDHSIFAWETVEADHSGNLLAESPANFAHADRIIQLGQPETFEMNNRGLRISLFSLPTESVILNQNHTWAALNCRFENDITGVIALRLTRYSEGDGYHSLKQDEHTNDSITQPWDLDSLSKFQPNSRLAFIKSKHLIHSIRFPLNITRRYEPRYSPVIFAIEAGGNIGEIVSVYPEYLWSPQDGIVNTRKQPRMRAGLVISGRLVEHWTIAFGFDQVDKPGEDDLIPHLSAQVHEEDASLDETCETARSFAFPDRKYPSKLVTKANSVKEPLQLLVTLQRSEIMGTIVYTVRIEFSGTIIELDSMETERVFVELDAVETQRATLRPAFQKAIDSALSQRQAILLSDLKKRQEWQDRLPLWGPEIKVRVKVMLQDDLFKLREVFPDDGWTLGGKVIGYSSPTKAFTLGMLIQSQNGTLYNVFIYHGYRALHGTHDTHNKLTLAAPTQAAPLHVSDRIPAADADLTSAEGMVTSQAGPVDVSAHSLKLGFEDNSSPGTRNAFPDSDVSPLSEDAPPVPDLTAHTQTSAPKPAYTRTSHSGGVLARIIDNAKSLEEMTRELEDCNQGNSLCGNSLHDSSCLPLTSTSIMSAGVKSLSVHMTQYTDFDVTLMVDIFPPTLLRKRSTVKRAFVRKQWDPELLGYSDGTVVRDVQILDYDEAESQLQDPNINFPNQDTDLSTLSGLRNWN